MRGLQAVVLVALFAQTTQLLPSPLYPDFPDEPLQECPRDSDLIDGACRCNPSLCRKPPRCPTDLVLVSNSTDIPGRCCPSYSCEGCPLEELIGGRCPCAGNATLNNAGDACECLHPYETLDEEDGVCRCDVDKCALPELCNGKSVPAKEPDGCCYKTKCIACPDDSFPVKYKDEQVEPKCVCYKCKKPECGTDKAPVVVRRGKGFPGMCCDLYDCKTVETKGCSVGNETYRDGDSWETSDGTCRCQKGISLCSRSNEVSTPPRSCFTEGKMYRHEESWMEDRCTNCTCDDGERKCIAHMCEVDERRVQKTDCEPLNNCNKSCVYGFKINKLGCEVCKCSKVNSLEEILNRFNISREDLVTILSKQTDDSSSTTASTAICIAADNCDGQEMEIPRFLTIAVLACGVLILLVLVLLAVAYCLLRGCKEQGKAVFPKVTPYSYSPVKAKLENNNNGRIYNVIDEKNVPEKFRLT